MKINQSVNNTMNFAGASSIDKYNETIKQAIKNSINSSFEKVLPQINKSEKIKLIDRLPSIIKNKKAVQSAFAKSEEMYNGLINLIAKGIGKASNTDLSKYLVKKLNYFKKPSARMADLASFVITFFYVNNTRKSEKIEEERKMPLMVNNITVTLVSSTMAALIDKGSDVVLDRVKGALCTQKGKEVLDGVINSVPDVASNLQGQSIEQLAEDILKSKEFRSKIKDYTKRFEKAKSLTIFSFTVRFLITVLMVPVAGKIVKIIKEKIKKEQQNPQT